MERVTDDLVENIVCPKNVLKSKQHNKVQTFQPGHVSDINCPGKVDRGADPPYSTKDLV